MPRKVQRPKAWDPKKVKGRRWSQPKIDGCRAYNPEGTLLARTQKQHANRYITSFFSKPEYIGFDGELAAGPENSPDLCRVTSSACGTIAGEPFVLWWVFDFVTADTAHLPYKQRYRIMEQRVLHYQAQGLCGHLRVVPYIECETVADVEAAHEHWMNLGYEGSCIYNPELPHKEGDSSATHGGVNRIKDFVDSEAIVREIVEGDTNNNIAQVNELGRTFRTSHQENKTPNGMVGSLVCEQLVDVFDEYDKKKQLMHKGQIFTCAPGAMDHKDRLNYFEHPEQILNHTITHRFFPKGIKDKPRFPQFVAVRSRENM